MAVLHAFHAILSVACGQVLFSRWLGQLKQGMLTGDDTSWLTPDSQLVKQMAQQNMHSFDPSKHKFVQTES
jgi:hypothetical protein